MPNRMLRDWTDSERIHVLSSEAERFFVRLIMKADDYGRYYGNIKLLRANLFPLYEKLKDEKVESWLRECIDAELIFAYEADGKRFLEIKMFDQKLKVRRSKFPPSNEEDRLALKEGYVYFIGTSFQKPVKIGFSVNPWSRLKEITTNHHEQLEILLTIKGNKQLESSIHKCIPNAKVKNEWFMLNQDLVDCFTAYSNTEIGVEYLFVELRRLSSLLRSTPEREVEENTEVEVEVEEKENATHANLSSTFIIPKNSEKKDSSPGAEISWTIEHCLTVAMNDDRWVADNKASPEKLALFNCYLSGQGIYEKNPMDYKRHFYHWNKKQKNATTQHTPKQSVTRKSAGAETLLNSLKADIAGLGS